MICMWGAVAAFYGSCVLVGTGARLCRPFYICFYYILVCIRYIIPYIICMCGAVAFYGSCVLVGTGGRAKSVSLDCAPWGLNLVNGWLDVSK